MADRHVGSPPPDGALGGPWSGFAFATARWGLRLGAKTHQRTPRQDGGLDEDDAERSGSVEPMRPLERPPHAYAAAFALGIV
jgi:hypothetical protein